MSEVMDSINQDPQCTSRHSRSSVFRLSLPVYRSGYDLVVSPILSHLVGVNMDQHTQKRTRALRNIKTALYECQIE